MISLALKKCLDNGIKIYPVFERQWFIEVKIGENKPKRIPKPVQQNKINEAVEKTIIHYSKTITNEKIPLYK